MPNFEFVLAEQVHTVVECGAAFGATKHIVTTSSRFPHVLAVVGDIALNLCARQEAVRHDYLSAILV
jgi:hypothetical protein